ncbi:PREDICTED: uncharacterized protein LOC109166318 isoform X2 [Ipomoea nil]|uniref:uncharacterized protein LOC109166318 isoform X2 n=1 Tax=Ipomoea nil TaxID=35883 RepID=UPI0009010525|nr:PREDICTED: uncharacterized protein LOC109166318 isoform X2 [Ipomoea nil]
MQLRGNIVDSSAKYVAMGRRIGADRKGKSPLGHGSEPFRMFFSTASGNEHLFQHATRKAREKFRRRGVPSRMFVTIAVTMGTVGSVSSSRNERLAWFTRRLDADVQDSKHVGLATLDMYIFPIMHRGRYYVMSISFKHSSFNIIDSSPARTGT